jgi:hypothetical protein
MKTYYVSPEVDAPRQRFLTTLLVTAFSVAALVLVDRVISRHQVELIDLVAFAIFIAAFNFWPRPEPGFDLEVDDTEIRVVRDGSVKSRITRDQTRYVHEWSGNIFRRPMLVISKHGPVAMRLFGFIRVPKTLPEYEQIKTQALGWLQSSGR